MVGASSVSKILYECVLGLGVWTGGVDGGGVRSEAGIFAINRGDIAEALRKATTKSGALALTVGPCPLAVKGLVGAVDSAAGATMRPSTAAKAGRNSLPPSLAKFCILADNVEAIIAELFMLVVPSHKGKGNLPEPEVD